MKIYDRVCSLNQLLDLFFCHILVVFYSYKLKTFLDQTYFYKQWKKCYNYLKNTKKLDLNKSLKTKSREINITKKSINVLVSISTFDK